MGGLSWLVVAENRNVWNVAAVLYLLSCSQRNGVVPTAPPPAVRARQVIEQACAQRWVVAPLNWKSFYYRCFGFRYRRHPIW